MVIVCTHVTEIDMCTKIEAFIISTSGVTSIHVR